MAAKGHFSRPDIKAMRERMQQTGSVDSVKPKPVFTAQSGADKAHAVKI
jgi:hypothetical protein